MKSVRFLTDFLAILGTDVVTNVNPNFQLFGLFKMIRVFRMGGMINRLNIPEKIKASLNLIKLVFYILLFLHVTACCLFIACHNSFKSNSEVLWYAPLHWVNYPDQYLFEAEIPIHVKYTIFFYYAVLIVGFNELGPANLYEFAIICSFLIAASFVNALVYSDIANLLFKIEKDQSDYQENLDDANSAMTNMNIPKDLRADITEFLSLTYDTQQY